MSGLPPANWNLRSWLPSNLAQYRRRCANAMAAYAQDLSRGTRANPARGLR